MKLLKQIFSTLAWISWALNLAALAGYFLLRRQMNAPRATTNKLRFLIIRPYKSEVNAAGEVVANSEHDEMNLMAALFRTAREYGNAKVVVVANNGDPGLDKIRALAVPYPDLVRVIEAPIMPPDTPSGQMFNHKVGWKAFAAEAQDNDILLTTDCDSDLTLDLVEQIAAAYEDNEIGGVGTYPLYQPAVDWPTQAYTMAINPGMGFLALSSALRGVDTMPGNLLSTRVSVFRRFGGYESYSRLEQLVDDVATSKKVLSTGYKLALVGQIRVYNRYGSFVAWWSRWSRMTVMLKATAPALYWPSPLPTYGGQVLAEMVMSYGLATKDRALTLPFIVNYGVNVLYAGITGGWRDGLFSPVSAPLNLAGWLYPLISNSKEVKWRGLVFKVKDDPQASE